MAGGVAIPETVTCPRCDSTVPWTEQEWDARQNCCRRCAAEASGAPPKAAPAPSDTTYAPPTGDASGQAIFLTLLGLTCIAVGLYYLVLHPSNPGEYGGDSGTVTIHRLVLGQTATLAG